MKNRKVLKRGTVSRPRLVVFRSNRYFYGQVIDDVKGHTMASINKITDIMEASHKLAEDLKKLKITELIFDRASYRYHGNVKKFAEKMREEGVKI